MHQLKVCEWHLGCKQKFGPGYATENTMSFLTNCLTFAYFCKTTIDMNDTEMMNMNKNLE